MSPLFLPRLLLVGAICAALVGLGGVLAHRYYAPKLEAEKRAFAEFRGGVEALGRAAEKRARETDEANRKRKELADAQAVKAKRDLDGLYAAYVGLRDSRNPGSRILPQPASGAGSAEGIAFDRTALDNALSSFDRGVTGLLREGDEALGSLRIAREWAAGR